MRATYGFEVGVVVAAFTPLKVSPLIFSEHFITAGIQAPYIILGMFKATFLQRITAARAGENPTVICRVPSGWAVLADMQFLRGYCILLADPMVSSINDLDRQARSTFLQDMILVGDAVLEVTGAYRVNYVIACNTDPYLHAHIVPRYLSEPDEIRKGLPWSYPNEVLNGTPFDASRDRELMQQLAAAINLRY
jgi:diadenosine tetraphosphate (Ap4A) HIT family hydrolase